MDSNVGIYVQQRITILLHRQSFKKIDRNQFVRRYLLDHGLHTGQWVYFLLKVLNNFYHVNDSAIDSGEK